MKEKVTVLDLMNYAACHYVPISGIAIQALMQKAGPDTPVNTDEETLEKIRRWKRKDNRLYNRIYRWLKWQWFKRRLNGKG